MQSAQFEDSEDAVILADCLLPLMQDVESGISLLALMHLSSKDIKDLMLFPDAARSVISDLAKFTRRSCRQLVIATKEKVRASHRGQFSSHAICLRTHPCVHLKHLPAGHNACLGYNPVASVALLDRFV